MGLFTGYQNVQWGTKLTQWLFGRIRPKYRTKLFHVYDVYTQNELYKKNTIKPGIEIIDIKSAVLTDFCRDANNVVKNDLTATVFDTTTRGDSARILLTNSTGANRYLFNCTIHGSLIKRHGGYVHDTNIDYESIRKNGEMLLEIGNQFICLKNQVEKIADYHYKFNRGTKHLYTLSFVGARHYFEVGEWYTLQINDTHLGLDEYMDMKCRCVGVSIERRADDLGATEVILEEVEENWTFDANSVARYVLSGNLGKLPSGEKIIVGASDFDGLADYYCDGTSDEDQINSAINDASGKGGGTVELTEGHFYTDGSIDLLSSVVLQGRGSATVIEKNCNDYGIYIAGGAGTELENISLLNFKITRNASDTNNKALIYATYAHIFTVAHILMTNSYSCGCYIYDGCRDVVLAYSDVQDSRGAGWLVTHTFNSNAPENVKLSTCSSRNAGTYGIEAHCERLNISNCYVETSEACGIIINSEDKAGLIANNTVFNNGIVTPGTSTLPGIYIYSADNIIVTHNECRNNGNLIAYSSCENVTDPYIIGDGSSLSNATFARSDTEVYQDSYSFKLTITAGGSEGIARQCDNGNTNDMHELLAGYTYKAYAYVYVPSTGGCTAAEAKLRFSYYDSGAWTDDEQAATGQDAWELLQTAEVTIPATATGAKMEVLIESTASDGEICYFDNLRLQPIGIHNEHEQNFEDDGTDTQWH